MNGNEGLAVIELVVAMCILGVIIMITTVTHGFDADNHVIALREFRDQYLVIYVSEKPLVNLSYQHSPLFVDFIHGKGSLRCIKRMGLSPLTGVSLIFAMISQTERWPALVTLAVILAVLLYMELLIRRKRGLG